MVIEADEVSKNAYIKPIKYFLNMKRKMSVYTHHSSAKKYGTEMFCIQGTH